MDHPGEGDKRCKGKAEPGEIEYVDSIMARTMAHPLRIQILGILNKRVMSPSGFARTYDLKLQNTSYHFRRLKELGLIEEVDSRQVRGSTEHFYAAVKRVLFDGRAWDELPPSVKAKVSAGILSDFRLSASWSTAWKASTKRRGSACSKPENLRADCSAASGSSSTLAPFKGLYLVLIQDTILCMIKNSDLYVLSGLLASQDDWTYRSLAERLHVPHPVVQRGLKRAGDAGLYSVDRRQVHLPHFEEFAVHALRFIAPAQLEGLVPGTPAAWGAEPMAGVVWSPVDEPPPVWPSVHGQVRGQKIEPLHPAATEAVADWSELGEILSLLDSLRGGDIRIRSVAERFLTERLHDRASA